MHANPLFRDADPVARKAPGFLYLRRHAGERIVAVDSRSCTWIRVEEIDLDADRVRLAIDGLDEPVTLDLYDELPFLQGDCRVRVGVIQENPHLGRSYVSLGVRAPRSMKIFREELIKGIDEEQLRSLASG